MAWAKPLKQSKKFKVQSLGLSVTEKASFMKIVIRPVVGVKIGGGKLPSTSATGGGVSHASACVVDLYASSASDKETIPPKPQRKHVGEHEEENSQLKATAVKLQGLVDSSAEIVAML
jgi:hypothetical protein